MEISSITPAVAATQTESASQAAEKIPQVAAVRQSESSDVSLSKPPQTETLEKVANHAQQINQMLGQLGQNLAFTVDEGTRSSVVKVIDKTTEEVIRQFPTEGSLQIMKNIQEYLNSVQEMGTPTKEGLTGTLFNEII